MAHCFIFADYARFLLNDFSKANAENVALANRDVTESGSSSFSALLVLRRHYPFETLMSIKPDEEILLRLDSLAS